MLAKIFLHGVSGELRITSALLILGGHRMALGCSGLHANGCFNACRNYPAPKNLCRNSPALPYVGMRGVFQDGGRFGNFQTLISLLSYFLRAYNWLS